MMLLRSDLMTENKQNSNAGNGGDLLKHSAYLALLDELVSVSHGTTKSISWRLIQGREYTQQQVRTYVRRVSSLITQHHVSASLRLPHLQILRSVSVQLPESEMANCLTLGHLCFTLVK